MGRHTGAKAGNMQELALSVHPGSSQALLGGCGRVSVFPLGEGSRLLAVMSRGKIGAGA
jgi:hypothetical protein